MCQLTQFAESLLRFLLNTRSVKFKFVIMEEKKAKMLKFIMGKGNQHTAERLKVQKELFGFNRVSQIFGICIHNFLLVTL